MPEPNQKSIVVNRDIQAERKQAASQWRDSLGRRGTFVVNLVSSPGAGKTSLLEETCRYWGDRWKVAVLVGDLETDRDAQRLQPFVSVRQLTTGGACHLELALVQRGFESLPAGDLDFLFIENIGNLVCPASHDLGEHLRVVLLSTTEGDDKPGKYPKMFRTSDLMVVTKTDLLPHVPFNMENALNDARLIRSDIDICDVAAISGDGIDRWCDYLERQRQKLVEVQSSV
jgi:hydrogenase nickel incorporation protein HypB